MTSSATWRADSYTRNRKDYKPSKPVSRDVLPLAKLRLLKILPHLQTLPLNVQIHGCIGDNSHSNDHTLQNPSAEYCPLRRILWEATCSNQVVHTGNIENTLRSCLLYWPQPSSVLASILGNFDLSKTIVGFWGQISHLKQLRASI